MKTKVENRIAVLTDALDRVRKKNGPPRTRYILFKTLLSLLDPKKLQGYPKECPVVREALAFVSSTDAVNQFRRDYVTFKGPRKSTSLRGGKAAKFGGGRVFGGGRYSPVDRMAARVSSSSAD
ncbi:MAG: hypothetical protein RJB04_1072 [Verrucomicrobiota bacterium]|jgi:hypothetical protein